MASIPPGWRGIYDQLIVDLIGLDPTLSVAQAKQKFGELRVYLADVTPEAANLIETATAASRTICEECSAPGRRRANRQGHCRTLCDQHAVD